MTETSVSDHERKSRNALFSLKFCGNFKISVYIFDDKPFLDIRKFRTYGSTEYPTKYGVSLKTPDVVRIHNCLHELIYKKVDYMDVSVGDKISISKIKQAIEIDKSHLEYLKEKIRMCLVVMKIHDPWRYESVKVACVRSLFSCYISQCLLKEENFIYQVRSDDEMMHVNFEYARLYPKVFVEAAERILKDQANFLAPIKGLISQLRIDPKFVEQVESQLSDVIYKQTYENIKNPCFKNEWKLLIENL